MFKLINSNIHFFFICQTANWQTVVLSDTEENACTSAIELMIREKKNFPIGEFIFCSKINFPNEKTTKLKWQRFFAPMILANAGFHNEAKNLNNFIKNEKQ